MHLTYAKYDRAWKRLCFNSYIFLKLPFIKSLLGIGLNLLHEFIPCNNPKGLVQMKFTHLQMKNLRGGVVRNLAKATQLVIGLKPIF